MKISLPCLLLSLLAITSPLRAESELRLQDIDLTRMSSGWKAPLPGRSVAGGPLKIGGESFADGVGVHAPGDVTIRLGKRASRFQARVGVDDGAADGAAVEFLIKGDGKELWRSGVVKRGDKARDVDLSLAGIDLLHLEVSTEGDPYSDHADWASARIVYTGEPPAAAPREGEIRIEAGPTTVRLQVDPRNKRLLQTSFGPVPIGLAASSQPNEEAYPGWGDGLVSRPALRVLHADGNTSTALEFVSLQEAVSSPGVTETRIALRDPLFPFYVTLVYRAYAAEGIIEQWTEIRHEEAGPVTLDRFASASLLFGKDTFFLTAYHAGWANEMTPEEERLTFGIKVIESSAGVRTHLEAAPSFLLSRGKPATETAGEVFGATLGYSGSFQFQFETSPEHDLRAICGINPEASSFRLPPGEIFKTPPLIYGWSVSGKGDLARRFSRWGRQHGMRDGERIRATLLNNWEATGFGFNEKKLEALIKDTRDLGMEMFLLDDGWFGEKHPRNGDYAGLGDWKTDQRKLPSGLSHLADEAKRQGVRFGLWVEPEMVNPSSELYESHPDWVIRQPGRDLRLSRNQLVLDLSNPKVRDWMFRTVDDLLTANPGISYLKWDCNRTINQPGSRWLQPQDQTHLGIEYQKGLYELLDRLAAKHPEVELMLCASGGGRVDYGSLRRGHEFWTSDNTDPLARVRIQWDTAQFFPQSAIAAHVTHMGKRPLKFAFDVAMSARLGMDIDTPRLSEEERTFTKEAIAAYRSIRPIVQAGDLYRLEPPHGRSRAAQMNVSPDKKRAVLFVWQLKDGKPSPVILEGLDPQIKYQLSELNLKPGTVSSLEKGKTLTGEALMKDGLTLPLEKTCDSAVIELNAVP